MQLVLSKHNNNITSTIIILWLILSKLDVCTSSPIHPCIRVQYKIEDITIVLAKKSQMSLLTALHNHSHWHVLGNNCPHMCIRASTLGLRGRKWINVNLVE
jgi:hypothetical protein